MEQVDLLLLRFYQGVERSGHDFESTVLRELGRLIGFDGAIWGEGRIDSVVQRVRIDRAVVVDRSDSILSDYAQLPKADPVSERFMKNPEIAQRVEVKKHLRGKPQHDVLEMLASHDVSQLLLQGSMDPSTGHVFWITAYRADSDKPFRSVEAKLFSKLLPHVMCAQKLRSLIVRSEGVCGHDDLASSEKIASRKLTSRQLEILKFLSLGLTHGEIGKYLGLSEYTVREHAGLIYSRLGVRNKTEAVFEARLLGLIR